MNRLRILSGNAHPELARKIADYIGEPMGSVKISRFPDGEIFVKIIENIRGQDVYIVQPTCHPPNENLMELLIMIDAARRASANQITAVIPFYGYARQDRKDQPRVPITAKLVANLLVAAGTSRILTMDLHAQQIQGFFDIPVDHLYSAPTIVKYLRALEIPDLVVVSPDPGGMKMAYAYAGMMGAGLAIVAKERKSATEVEAVTVVGDVEGKNCLMVDDLTTTAGTLASAATLLVKRGAKTVIAAVTHAVLTEDGIERLKASPVKRLITTDTVPPRDWRGFDVKVLSVAELLGEAILRVHNNQSVTSLFRV
jgi:ribose-phosphate pyrophosphokinase